MKVIGINGGPRKKNNTATILDFALNGAKAQGADVERADLYDLRYTGCRSCLECKRMGGQSFGRCALRDDLTGVLQKIIEANVLIVASPVYFGDVTGQMRSFLERLWYPSLLYSADGKVAYDKKLKVGMIYTTGVEDPIAVGYDGFMGQIEKVFEAYVGETESIVATGTYLFPDYSKYASSMFDPEHRKRLRDERFPQDCEKAFQLGAKLAGK